MKLIRGEMFKIFWQHLPQRYLWTDQDTVMGKSTSEPNMSIRLVLLGGLMVHRELELPFRSVMVRSSGK